MSQIETLFAEFEAKLAELKATVIPAIAPVAEPVIAAVEPVVTAIEAAPAEVVPTVETVVEDVVTGTPDVALADDIAAAHARIDGIATALVTAIQSLDAKIDAKLDGAQGWALHPKVAAAGAGGAVVTAVVGALQASGTHVGGGQTVTAGAAALVALVAGYLKKA